MTLSAANTYTGGTTVTAGTLGVSGSGTVGAISNAVTVSGGILDLGGTSQTQNGGVTLTSGTIQNGTLSSTGTFGLQSGTVSATLAGRGPLKNNRGHRDYDRHQYLYGGHNDSGRHAATRQPQIALDQIKAARDEGVPEGVVLADAGYGINTAFRTALTRMGLTYVVGVQSSARLWPPGSGPLPPKAWSGQGRPPTLMRRDVQNKRNPTGWAAGAGARG